MGIKTKFNPLGGISSSDKGKLSLWRYSNDVITGKTLLYNYIGSWDVDTLYVPMCKGKSIINDWFYGSGITDDTPFYKNRSVVNVDLQGVSFRNNSMLNAFYNCNNLLKVNNIPNSVMNMASTFAYCYNLNQNIQIPNSVTSMASTFQNCWNLNQNIQIPNSVTNMYATFEDCRNLNQNIQIPKSVTYMYDTFCGCYNLKSCINILSTQITDATRCFSTTNASANPNVIIQSRYINNVGTKTWNALNTAGWRFTIAKASSGGVVGTSPNQVAAWDWICGDWPTYTGNGTHWVVSKWSGNLSAFFNGNSAIVDLTIPNEICGYPVALSSSCFNGNVTINSIDCNHTTMIPSSSAIFNSMPKLNAIWNINLNGVTQAYVLTWNCQNAKAISVGTPQYGTGYLNFEDAVVNAQAQYGWCTNLSNMYLLGKGITKCFAAFNHCNTRDVNIYISGAGYSNYGNWFLGWNAIFKKSVIIYFQYSNGVNTPVWNVYKDNKSYYGTSGNAASVNPMFNGESRFYIYNMSKDFCTTTSKKWMCCPVNGAIRYTGDGYVDEETITIPTSLSVAKYPDKNVTVTTNADISFPGLFYGFFKFNANVIIPQGVTSLSYTFQNCWNLNQNIQIPNSVTNMYDTFWGCTNLNQNIQIPNLVTNMYATFYSCSNLSGRINVLTTELVNSNRTFSDTSLQKDVYIYFNYANGVATKTYNQVVASTNASNRWGGKNGVTVYNLGKAPW